MVPIWRFGNGCLRFGSDVVRLLWSKADVYDGPQYCTLQYGPDLVLLGISDLVRFTPIWSDLVRFGN